MTARELSSGPSGMLEMSLGGAANVGDVAGVSKVAMLEGLVEVFDIDVTLLNVVFSSSQSGNVMFSGILIIEDSSTASSTAEVFREGGKKLFLTLAE